MLPPARRIAQGTTRKLRPPHPSPDCGFRGGLSPRRSFAAQPIDRAGSPLYSEFRLCRIRPTLVQNLSNADGSQPRLRAKPMEHQDLKDLEERVNDLVAKCARLQEENYALRHQQNHLIAERAALIEKTEQARTRVESMITRLKSMEL